MAQDNIKGEGKEFSKSSIEDAFKELVRDIPKIERYDGWYKVFIPSREGSRAISVIMNDKGFELFNKAVEEDLKNFGK